MPFNSFSVVMVLITPSALKAYDKRKEQPLDIAQVTMSKKTKLMNELNCLKIRALIMMMFDIPLLDSGEIKSHLTVSEGFLVQVSPIPSDECRHVIA